MNALPCYTDYRLNHYLQLQDEADRDAERLEDQVKVELASRETWELGMSEASIEERGKHNPIIDALMAGDDAQAGFLIRQYITERYAPEMAQQALDAKDEDRRA